VKASGKHITARVLRTVSQKYRMRLSVILLKSTNYAIHV